MDDKNSLLNIKSGFSFNFKSFRKYSVTELVLPLVGFLIFLVCLLFIFSVLAATGVDCDDGWSGYGSNCYKLLTEYSDIDVCRRHCRQAGGDLASIHSKEENDFIKTLQGDKLTWFGGRIAEKDGEFTWVDGTEWNFDDWDKNEPDRKNFGKIHHECTFLAIDGQQGRGNRGAWWDGVCSWEDGGFDCLCKV